MFDDRTRREALARNLCARICDERRGLGVLEALDKLLTRLDDPLPGLLSLLETDRYEVKAGYSELEVQRREGFNAGMEHALSVVRADRGLTELRRQTLWPDEEGGHG